MSVILLFTFGCASENKEKNSDVNLVQNNSKQELSRLDKIPADAIKIIPSVDVYPPKLHSVEWETPVPLGSEINTAGAEDSPFITPDGNELYFFFTPDPNIPAEKQLLDGVTGIYVSKKQLNGLWGEATRVNLQDSGKLSLDGCEFVQGNTIFFCSAREGYNGINWFSAELKDGEWQNWRYEGGALKQKEYEVGELHISQDGDELYFHSARQGGKGGLDIWMTKKINGEWQVPVNIETVNTPDNEGWPFLSQDKNELWFLRTYQGSPALFRSKNINGTWQIPELIVSQFAGEPTLDNQGNLYFVHHFYKDGNMLEADIYVAYKK